MIDPADWGDGPARLEENVLDELGRAEASVDMGAFVEPDTVEYETRLRSLLDAVEGLEDLQVGDHVT